MRLPSLARAIHAFALVFATAATSAAFAQQTNAVHGRRPARLVIRGATIVDGNGTPARGPVDIVIEGNTITDVVALDAVALRGGSGGGAGGSRRPADDVNIDATGKFVLPGLINAHAHLQSNRAGRSLGGYDDTLKLGLANGMTSVREVGSESDTGIV